MDDFQGTGRVVRTWINWIIPEFEKPVKRVVFSSIMNNVYNTENFKNNPETLSTINH